jgi:hypothetical protein
MLKSQLTGRRAHIARLAIGALVFVAACSTDQLLKATDPDIINPSDTKSSEAAVALANGAINTFRGMTGAYGQSGTESTWLFGGLLADEWSTSSTFVQNDETDQRQVQEFNSSVTAELRQLYRTRTRAIEAYVAVRELRPDLRALIAELYLAKGFAELQLASDFCNGIPISDGNASPPVDGPPKSTTEVFQMAAVSLDSAILYANGTDAQSVLIYRASKTARARVALALGNFTEAGTLVTGLPTAWSYQHTYSLATSTNAIWGQGLSARRYSVGDSLEGNSRNILVANAIPFASSKDPRLPVTIPTSGAINGQDGLTYARTTTMWQQLTPVDVVNGVDARMIEAEAALKAGNVTGWLAIHNALRAAPPKLGEIQPVAMAPLTDPGTDAARVSLQFREKAFWTFGRGQRLGDMRRLIKQYGRTEANTFPQGVHYKGGSYGKDVNLPVVTDERNNALFNGCTDRLP